MGLGSAMEARGVTPPDILCAIDQHSGRAPAEPREVAYLRRMRSLALAEAEGPPALAQERIRAEHDPADGDAVVDALQVED